MPDYEVEITYKYDKSDTNSQILIDKHIIMMYNIIGRRDIPVLRLKQKNNMEVHHDSIFRIY